MDKFFDGPTLVGIRVNKFSKGTRAVSLPKQALQVLTLKRDKGEHIKAHLHVPKQRITERLQECLVLRKGRIKINLYNSRKKYLQSLYVKKGEFFILINGGYSIDVIESAEIIEIKNGPFLEDKQLI